MLIWYFYWTYRLRSPPVPYWFPATVGIGMVAIAGSKVGMASWLQEARASLRGVEPTAQKCLTLPPPVWARPTPFVRFCEYPMAVLHLSRQSIPALPSLIGDLLVVGYPLLGRMAVDHRPLCILRPHCTRALHLRSRRANQSSIARLHGGVHAVGTQHASRHARAQQEQRAHARGM